MKHGDYQSMVTDLRSMIDEADSYILQALSKRRRSTALLGKIKKINHQDITDPTREEAVKQHWKELSQQFHIPKELALLMLDFILIDSKTIQEEVDEEMLKKLSESR